MNAKKKDDAQDKNDLRLAAVDCDVANARVAPPTEQIESKAVARGFDTGKFFVVKAFETTPSVPKAHGNRVGAAVESMVH